MFDFNLVQSIKCKLTYSTSILLQQK